MTKLTEQELKDFEAWADYEGADMRVLRKLVKSYRKRLKDDWIEWDANAPDAMKGPDLPQGTRVETRLRNGTVGSMRVEEWYWALWGSGTITHYRIVK